MIEVTVDELVVGVSTDELIEVAIENVGVTGVDIEEIDIVVEYLVEGTI